MKFFTLVISTSFLIAVIDGFSIPSKVTANIITSSNETISTSQGDDSSQANTASYLEIIHTPIFRLLIAYKIFQQKL